MGKCRRRSHLKTVPNAVQSSTGSLRRELQNILGLFRWDLFTHNLARGDFAHFEGNQGTGADLTGPVSA